MPLKGLSHTRAYRRDASCMQGMLTLARVSELTKETLLDLNHHVDFSLAADEFGPVEPHCSVRLRVGWVETEKYSGFSKWSPT